MEIGANAHLEKRRHMLMQFYDEAVRCSLFGHPSVARTLRFALALLRKEWQERSMVDPTFDVNVACLSINRDILEFARTEFDDAFPKNTASERESTHSSFGGSGRAQQKPRGMPVGVLGNASPRGLLALLVDRSVSAGSRSA